jgi:hypothetical protein
MARSSSPAEARDLEPFLTTLFGGLPGVINVLAIKPDGATRT